VFAVLTVSDTRICLLPIVCVCRLFCCLIRDSKYSTVQNARMIEAEVCNDPDAPRDGAPNTKTSLVAHALTSNG
jgi:hypothetical protein